MSTEEAKKVVLALIASGRLPLPSKEKEEDFDQWSERVMEAIDSYIRSLKKTRSEFFK